ncbi:TonB-dependent receptor domain-containing protein [Aquimarina sp. I32.4]|uniref:TonB-dependent receptor domain-containing protein n=1 Tax=Aquimarina sp. I32.4 TaxID=2053903 RepID=UPI000CDF0BFC|nr:TonB-dependent receptor [Aquimarina sp. I32.4]
MKIINTVIICACFMLTMVVSAQNNNSTIKGTVSDEKGNSVESATIQIKGADKGAITSTIGSYVLSNITTQKVTLQISKTGHQTIYKEATLTSGENIVNITLPSKIEQLGEVTLNGQKIKSQNNTVVSSNKLGVKAIDMPNSSGIISGNLIKEQQALTLGEVISNVSGVFQFNKGYGGTSETFAARGISLRYLGFMFRDGTRFGTNQSLGTPELQAFEKIEILKGGAAINFGYISPGATINYVTKKPVFETKGTVSMRVGSYDYYKPTVDFNGLISDKLAIRIVSTTDIAQSFRENVESKRIFNYGALRYKASEQSYFDFNIDYTIDERPRDFGLPIFENQIITGYETVDGKEKPVYMQTEGTQRLYSGITKDIRDRFLGSSFNQRNSTQLNSNLAFHTNLNENWNLSVSTGLSFSAYDYQQTGSGFRNKYIQEGNDIQIIRTLETADWEEETFGAQANLRGKFDFLGMTNNLSINIDYDNRTQLSHSFPFERNLDTIYLFNRNAVQSPGLNPEKFRTTKTTFRGLGISVQNLVNVTDKFNVLASLRLDNVSGASKNTHFQNSEDIKGQFRGRATFRAGDVVITEHDDIALTPSAGLVYKFFEANSIYASYTNSFRPNTRAYLDINDKVLAPYYTDQYEIGTKNSFFNGKIETNLSYYIINDKSYLAVQGEDDRYEIGSGTEYKGLEFDISTTPFKGLFLSANYSYIDAEFGAGGSRKEGTRPQQTPEHQIGFWSKYKFDQGILKNFSLNVGGQYTSERLGNDVFTRSTVLPYVQESYTLLNAGAAYESKKIDVALRVSNLLDEFVFFSYRTGSVNPIDPTMVSLTTTLKF